MSRPAAGVSNRISDSEADLHRLWARIAGRTLQGDEGRYQVILPGRHNSAAGPDFLGAVIRSPDGINLKGDVEIHPSRYGWRAHRHHEDPRYSAVIAHVVAAGPLRGVNSVSGRIPTLRMPIEISFEARPCEEGARLSGDAAASEGEEWVAQLALLRWHSRFQAWQTLHDDARLMQLARRLGPGAGADRLYFSWQKYLAPGVSLLRFLDQVGCGGSLEAGGATERKLQRRARLLSAVAHYCRLFPGQLPDDGWEATREILRQLRKLGFVPPAQPFAVEVAGNWLIPWLAVNRGIDGYEQWCTLPRGWAYARVNRFAEKVGLPQPASFAQQQGWLEWEQSLCASGSCRACILSG